MFRFNFGAQLCASAGAFVLITLTGCANLDAIREFGKLSSDSAGFTKQTAEYVSTYERRKAWTFKDRAEQLAALDADTAARKPQAIELKLYHKVVSDYMSALADLAADEVPTYDKELGGLVDQAVKLKAIDETNAAAAKQISTIIADAATNLYRQRKLKYIIGEANPPLQQVLARMQFFVEQYQRTAKTEKDAFDSYYQSLEDLARKANEAMFAQYAWAMKNELEPARQERVDAAKAYLETIREISQAHQNLYDNRDRIDNKEFLTQFRRYTKAIYAAYKATREPATAAGAK